MISRTIYGGILILAVLIGIYFYGIAPENFDPQFLLYFSLVPFLLFAAGIHGLIAHLYRPSKKSHMLVFPIAMGAVFVVLLLIHIFVVLPIVCPGFLGGS